MYDLDQKKAELNVFGVMLIVIALFCVVIFMTGCKSIHEVRTIKTVDHIRNITITETIYRDDTSFSLGTTGKGTYQIFSVNGVGL